MTLKWFEAKIRVMVMAYYIDDDESLN